MRTTMPRLAMMLALVAIISLSGMALVADSPRPQHLTSVEQQDDEGYSTGLRQWHPCPWPPCMAPCAWPGEPEVLCKPPTGKPVVTSFACCCCGGSDGTRYRPL